MLTGFGKFLVHAWSRRAGLNENPFYIGSLSAKLIVA
jgi:hypothetical protein